jgi:hypothetical protein
MVDASKRDVIGVSSEEYATDVELLSFVRGGARQPHAEVVLPRLRIRRLRGIDPYFS